MSGDLPFSSDTDGEPYVVPVSYDDQWVKAENTELQLNAVVDMFMRDTAVTRAKTYHVGGVTGPHGADIVVQHVADKTKLTTDFRTTRANLFRVSGTEDEKLEKLKRNDTVGKSGELSGTRMTRDTSRLRDAVHKASKCVNPSFRIYGLQRKTPLGFGPTPAGDTRPLRPHGLVVINELAKTGLGDDGQPVVDHVYKKTMMDALERGDYTTHDPDTLHPRFLEYVHERITELPPRTEKAMKWACKVMRKSWERNGVRVKARTTDYASKESVEAFVKAGSSGEYTEKGISTRTDPRMVELLYRSLDRFVVAGHSFSTGRAPPPWVHFTQQPVMSFGKTELKAAKEVDGQRQAPVPRFIFNVSPVNYVLASYLHGDLSHSLQDRDPMHGPGFGPVRARAGKFLDKVSCHLVEGKAELTCKAVMSDISKWDANMPEVLIAHAFDLMESMVDKSDLDRHSYATRTLMLNVARRQLLSKVVEHPSGYFVELFGCMPSGSFYTSVLNTVANDLLALSLLGMELMAMGREDELEELVEQASLAADKDLLSYGDNQIIFSSLFEGFGCSYDKTRHAEHLSTFGMKLKVDETDVSDKLSRVRFCSRGVLLTPHGLALTRSHESVMSKLGGRPIDDPACNKLYVRALMVDLVGTDPILYRGLEMMDESIHVPMGYEMSSAKVERIIKPFAKRLYGDTQEGLSAFAQFLGESKPPSRRLLLGLSLSRLDKDAVLHYGTSLMGLETVVAESLGKIGEWLDSMTPDGYRRYLIDTGQLDNIYGP
uniref:RNA-dependent RNA polymerase n=1 Tax=Erysiphe necator associated polymycovirus 2 TaxID=2742556 RepID=A0A8E3YZC4_9VIRU|nr:RNA-dependent RNA polymerase [Erysiphe necator associated polymycovirus 2]